MKTGIKNIIEANNENNDSKVIQILKVIGEIYGWI